MEFWRVGRQDGMRVGHGLTVAIVASDGERDAKLAETLLRQGARVAVWREGELLPDAHLAVIDGDAAGGADRAEDRLRLLRGRLACPVAVMTGRCREQIFPADPLSGPIRLRAPLSPVTARILMDYVAARIPA